MRNTIEIVGVKVDNINYAEGEENVVEFLEGDGLNMIFTPNSEIMVDAVRDRELENILNDAQLIIADGIGVVIASKLYGTPLKDRVTGADLSAKILELAAARGNSIFLLGAEQASVEAAAQTIKERYPGIKIAGIRNGYFSEDDEAQIIEEINNSRADVLIVGLGAPKQEKFIYRHKDDLKVKIAIGVGGVIDIYSGRKKRAPEIYQKLGLEWFYYLVQQPSRIKRIGKLPKFVLLALYDAMTRSREH
ncbi:MAG: tagA [Clostridia bacterium]|jgi:N-acetylglucosaminyldiphosphoundecaprenol N-acetyl-beta-D-mannosaminyltransferase|nr:tagA [Clostridia bacterium]